MDDFLEIEAVSHRLGGQRVLDGVSFSVEKGEVFSLLGPSGCGKTTLLRLIAGFVHPDAGRILLRGKDISRLAPEERPVNTVFQNYALFPHLTVAENVGFGLRVAGRPGHEIRERAERMLELVRMSDLAKRMPSKLSGGQKQRVALARALVKEPEVLLLDEPLAALDLKLRQAMLEELQTLHRELGTTFVYVTHDQGEALRLSDRMAVMEAGRIVQTGAPHEVYDQPATAFVAEFIGESNVLSGIVCELAPRGLFRLNFGGAGTLLASGSFKPAMQQSVRFMIRPERIGISRTRPASSEGKNVLPGEIRATSHHGPRTRFDVRVGGGQLKVDRVRERPANGECPLTAGEPVWLTMHPEDVRLLEEGSP